MSIEAYKQAAADAVAALANKHGLDSKAIARIQITVLQTLLAKCGRGSDAKYIAEYNANANYARLGLSLDDYISSRRVDDGLDPLAPDVTETSEPAAEPVNVAPHLRGGNIGSEI